MPAFAAVHSAPQSDGGHTFVAELASDGSFADPPNDRIERRAHQQAEDDAILAGILRRFLAQAKTDDGTMAYLHWRNPSAFTIDGTVFDLSDTEQAAILRALEDE